MRVTVGTISGLCLAVAVAVAQPPAPRERAAILLPPQAIAPGDQPEVARGAADDFPSTLSSSPVVRPATPGWRVSPAAASGSTWLTSPDQNVVPASASTTGTSSATGTPGTTGTSSSITPTPDAPTLQPPAQPKMLSRIKGTFGGDKPGGPKQPAQGVGQPEQPTAASPFRGTGSNGAPVYAGPPAYRWYGWGSVTPGANPLAPAGQYPKASANWYAITGATPGAFPVPVGDAARTPPGTEPPTYGLAARTPPLAQAAPPAPQPQPQPAIHYTERTEAPRFSPGVGPKFMPGSDPAVSQNPVQPERPTGQPKFMPGPDQAASAAPQPAFNPPPVPAGVPTLTPPPFTKPIATSPQLIPTLPPLPTSVAVVKEPESLPLKTIKEPELVVPVIPAPKQDQAVSAPPSVLPPLPVPVIATTPPVEPVVRAPILVSEPKPINVTPPPLPTTVTTNPPREELHWQQSAEPAAPAPGTWAPVPGMPLPTVPVETAPAAAPPVARGQMGDQRPDPIATLIKQVCQGRAEGVEVRWTGTKKLSVCFELRTKAEAQRLVSDISRRQELISYQIDFCALIK